MDAKTRLLMIVVLLVIIIVGLAVICAQYGKQVIPATITPSTTEPADTRDTSTTPDATVETGTPPATPVAEDDVPMVKVPAGEFLMGSTYADVQTWRPQLSEVIKEIRWAGVAGQYTFVDELYQMTVYLDGFEIDQYEVTNTRYRGCVEAGLCQPPGDEERYREPAYADHPVIEVTVEDAETYCRWVGKRLPTEVEWEKAARGTDGRIYPWGNEWDAKKANVSDEMVPVGSYPAGASPYGALDMVGNASEWVADRYALYPGNSLPEEVRAPIGKPVSRGGARSTPFYHTPELSMRAAMRYAGDLAMERVGFRCARGPVPPALTSAVVRSAAPQPLPTQTGVDLTDMVLVSAGEFIMGTDEPPEPHITNASPAHVVYLDAFYIDKYEVTWAQFATFLNTLGRHKWACDGGDCLSRTADEYRRGEGGGLELIDGEYRPVAGYTDFPADDVTWYGAQAYCRWLGKQLPTEAEWEKAARGTDGRKYPWGDEWVSRDMVGDSSHPREVGSYPLDVSPFGTFDMLGNAREWTMDWYDAEYYSRSPYRNPTGPPEPNRWQQKSLRVGGPIQLWGVTARGGGEPRGGYSGFRCAYTP